VDAPSLGTGADEGIVSIIPTRVKKKNKNYSYRFPAIGAMMIPMWTADEIRALRDGYGETQREFVRRLGVSLETLRFWEQGRGVPSGPAAFLLERLREDLQAGKIRTLQEPVAAH
jgi:putative transcriptional regulator